MFLLVIRNPLKNQLTFIDAYNHYMRKDNFHVYVERFIWFFFVQLGENGLLN